ncbi:MAG: MFS transporter [Candidatus Thiodiazotropha sp.]
MSFGIFPIITLLLGIGILLVGNGMLAVLIGLVAGQAFSETVTGIVMSGYFVGFVGGSFIIPPLIRSVGYIRTFAGMAALASVATVAYGAFQDPVIWWLLRVISGICLVGIYIVVESWLNEQVPSKFRGRIFAIYMMVNMIALGLGMGSGPLFGNLDTFTPYVIASVLFTLGLVPVAFTPMPQPQSIPTPSPGFKHLYSASPTGFIGAVFSGVLNGILWGLGPIFWLRLGLSEAESATFMALVIGGGALLQWPIGHLSDGHDRRKIIIAVCLAAAMAALLISTTATISRLALAVCAFLYGGLMLTLYSVSVAHVNDRVEPGQILEAARTLLLLYGFGAMAGPAFSGPFMEYFGPSALPVISAAALIVLAGVAFQQILTIPSAQPSEQLHFVPMTRTSQAAVEMLPEAAGVDIPVAAKSVITSEVPLKNKPMGGNSGCMISH